MANRNPWALTPEQAVARDDAILEQFLKAKAHAEKVHTSAYRCAKDMERQFGNAGVRLALARAIKRREAQS